MNQWHHARHKEKEEGQRWWDVGKGDNTLQCDKT
jgi:hypothetical protein